MTKRLAVVIHEQLTGPTVSFTWHNGWRMSFMNDKQPLNVIYWISRTPPTSIPKSVIFDMIWLIWHLTYYEHPICGNLKAQSCHKHCQRSNRRGCIVCIEDKDGLVCPEAAFHKCCNLNTRWGQYWSCLCSQSELAHLWHCHLLSHPIENVRCSENHLSCWQSQLCF